MDPMEQLVTDALDKAGIEYSTEGEESNVGLDFYIPDCDLHIEVKQFHSNRIARQMARAENVIAVQGEASVRWLCALIAKPARVAEAARSRITPKLGPSYQRGAHAAYAAAKEAADE
jgi:hypothetical protein